MKKMHLKGSHLYFIRSGEYIKIGRADNVLLRLKQLRAMNPYDVDLVHVVEGAGNLEHHYHEVFKERHHTGEWFRLKDCEVINIGNIDG